MQLARLAMLAAFLVGTVGPPGDDPPAVVDLKPVTVSVVDQEGGAAVTAFRYQVSYNVPGLKNLRDDDAWTPVTSPEGTFEIQAPASCRLSIGVRAPDYVRGAGGGGEFAIKSTDNPRRVVVKLRKGITVKGIVLDSKTRKPIAEATVCPIIPAIPMWTLDDEKQVQDRRRRPLRASRGRSQAGRPRLACRLRRGIALPRRGRQADRAESQHPPREGSKHPAQSSRPRRQAAGGRDGCRFPRHVRHLGQGWEVRPEKSRPRVFPDPPQGRVYRSGDRGRGRPRGEAGVWQAGRDDGTLV